MVVCFGMILNGIIENLNSISKLSKKKPYKNKLKYG
jgi:hypothetical protein